MPTYEYDCRECGQRAEFFQGMSEAPKRKCPHCGAPKGLVRRVGAGAGLIFKGSGFYATDYRKDSYKDRARKDVESPAESRPKDAAGKAGASTEATTAGEPVAHGPATA